LRKKILFVVYYENVCLMINELMKCSTGTILVAHFLTNSVSGNKTRLFQARVCRANLYARIESNVIMHKTTQNVYFAQEK